MCKAHLKRGSVQGGARVVKQAQERRESARRKVKSGREVAWRSGSSHVRAPTTPHLMAWARLQASHSKGSSSCEADEGRCRCRWQGFGVGSLLTD